MKTIVQNIRRVGDPASYSVELTADGVPKVYGFEVSLPDMLGASTRNRDYYRTFLHSRAGRKLVSLIIAKHKGEEIEFPVDLGDI